MPTEFLQALDTKEGRKVFQELWPDVVNAYIKALSYPAPRK